VRLDDAVMQTSEGWAGLLRGERHIEDFTGWKEHHSYQKSFDRLMRDLRVEPQPVAAPPKSSAMCHPLLLPPNWWARARSGHHPTSQPLVTQRRRC
jgi:hypothetical protein